MPEDCVKTSRQIVPKIVPKTDLKIISEIIPKIVPKTYFEESYLGGKRCGGTKEATTYSELFDYFVPEFVPKIVPKTVSKTVPKCALKTNFQGFLVAKGEVLKKSQHF